MAKFRITGPDGGVYEIDAPNDAAADAAVQQMFGSAAPTAGPPTMATADSTQIPIPEGADPKAVMNAFVTGEFEQPEAPVAPVTAGTAARNAAGYAAQTGAVGLRGGRQGLAALTGLPVDIASAGMRAVGLPVGEAPVMGSEWLDEVMGAPARAVGAGLSAAGVPDVPDADTGAEPQDVFQRIIQRIGYELGATALPAGAALALGPALGVQTTRQMANTLPAVAEASGVPGLQAVKQFGNDAWSAIQSTAGRALETAAVNPGAAAARATAGAVAAGTGAGVANEVAGNPQIGDNFWSDLLGSVAGVAGASTLGGGVKTAGDLIRAVFGSPNLQSDVVKEEVAGRLINNSTQMGQQFVDTGAVDTAPLVSTLRAPSPAEEAVPGFRANIGDRSQDPGLATFAFNQDAAMAGASNSRKVGNEQAIGRRMDELAPEGNAGQFRADIQGSVDRRVSGAENAAADANAEFDRSTQQLRSTMTGEGRGADIRAALEDSSATARELVARAWAPLNRSPVRVNTEPLAGAYDTLSDRMSVAENRRFLPNEANIPRELAPTPPGPPVDTGLVDAQGFPITRPGVAGQQTAPIREITGLRSALTDARREALTAGKDAEARIIGQHIDALDTYVQQSVPAEWRTAYDTARETRRDFADRFERPQTAIAQTLDRQQGLYRQPDSGVARKFVQEDSGRISDFQALIRESGADARVRGAIRDQMLSDIEKRGLLDNPSGLDDYLGRYTTVLDQFPDLRQQLSEAGGLRRAAEEATGLAATTRQSLTTPGRSPEADYLRFSDDRTLDATRKVVSSPDPRASIRQLLDAAGRTKASVENARTAFWTNIQDTGRMSASGITGEDRWSGRKLRGLLDDPKSAAVLEELYADNPEQLADMATVFDALAKSESSTRAKAAGTSGTAQGRGAVTGKFDPALSASSLASRVRSVHRGQLSPGIAAIDVLTTWMRRRSAQVQSRAIDSLASAVVNNPDLAADLLEQFNPADYAAKRRTILQKYGVRATQVLNLLDEAQAPQDDTMDVINGDDR